MTEMNRFSTWVEVDLEAIARNVSVLAAITQVKLMVVVKASGYGHGAVQVAKAALSSGASWCAVARIEEALIIRRAGIESPILVMGLTPKERLLDALREQISLTIWSNDQIEPIKTAAEQSVHEAKLHLKVNTGMNRLGCQPEHVLGIAQGIKAQDRLGLEGVFTHFACADELGAKANQTQLQQFLDVLSGLEQNGLKPGIIHAANSAAALSIPAARFDAVRIGIAMYGLHPSNEILLPDEFQAALTWKTQLSQVRWVPPGSGISYGHNYVTKGEERIGTLPVGYADGFRRVSGNEVLIRGRIAPIVGRVCMDQCLVQLDGIPEAEEGDEVILIGSQEGAQITAEDVARRWQTINYEVTCGIGSRVPRLYSGL